MKIKNPTSGNSKQGLLELFANRLYSSDPAVKYFDSLDYRPGAVDEIYSGYTNPLSFKRKDLALGTGDIGTYSNAGTTGRLLWENMKAHPVKSGVIGLGAAGNLSGVFDNDKLAGQIAGLTGGALASKFLLPKLGVPGIANSAMLTLGAGTLGSLFDKLRAKKAEEEAAMAQYYGG